MAGLQLAGLSVEQQHSFPGPAASHAARSRLACTAQRSACRRAALPRHMLPQPEYAREAKQAAWPHRGADDPVGVHGLLQGHPQRQAHQVERHVDGSQHCGVGEGRARSAGERACAWERPCRRGRPGALWGKMRTAGTEACGAAVPAGWARQAATASATGSHRQQSSCPPSTATHPWAAPAGAKSAPGWQSGRRWMPGWAPAWSVHRH